MSNRCKLVIENHCHAMKFWIFTNILKTLRLNANEFFTSKFIGLVYAYKDEIKASFAGFWLNSGTWKNVVLQEVSEVSNRKINVGWAWNMPWDHESSFKYFQVTLLLLKFEFMEMNLSSDSNLFPSEILLAISMMREWYSHSTSFVVGLVWCTFGFSNSSFVALIQLRRLRSIHLTMKIVFNFNQICNRESEGITSSWKKSD
jgi:hypothetical protein